MTDYVGSIAPMCLQAAHGEIYLRVTTGQPLTKAHIDELKASPWVVRYEDVDLGDYDLD